jgi:AcrR family transcriptional regulator
MPSTLAEIHGRTPQQARATLRREKFLEVAGDLIGELGFEPVTMTAIAEQAHASIGALYDYFPDKQALGLALLARYTEEADKHWAELLDKAGSLTKTSLADLFVEGILAFVRKHPAYLALLRAPISYSRSAAGRQPLRTTIAGALQTVSPNLPADQAFLSAQVIVELIKGLLAVYKQAPSGDKIKVENEFKKLMRLYLNEAIS